MTVWDAVKNILMKIQADISTSFKHDRGDISLSATVKCKEEKPDEEFVRDPDGDSD